MEKNIETAVLVVSFGTTHADTRAKTIEALEKDFKNSFKDFKIYRAWTSSIIIKKLKESGELFVDDVASALKKMHREGIKKVIVQPSHIINGIENDNMLRAVQAAESLFEAIVCSSPLLSSEDDYSEISDILSQIINSWHEEKITEKNLLNSKDCAVVLMGHGSSHHANSAYAALEYSLRDGNLENVFVANVEAYPYIDTVIKRLKKLHYQKIFLTPFMIVAGEHAKEDMAGEEKNSWKNLCLKEGFEVEYLLKGLGEYQQIRQLFIKHAKAAAGNL